MNSAPTRVVAYIRVSTEKQADKGQSLEAQKAKVEAYAALHDLTLVDVVVDAESAKSLDREGLRRALGMLGGAADAILVTKLDRLTRSVADLGELIERHFSGESALLSVAEHVDTRSAAGRLVLNVLASVSQWEREVIGERTSEVLQHKARQGEHTGGEPPFGWRIDATTARVEIRNGKEKRIVLLAPHADEQAVITRARELAAEGRSLRAVSAALAAEGRLSRKGTPFAPLAVSRMVEGARVLAAAGAAP